MREREREREKERERDRERESSWMEIQQLEVKMLEVFNDNDFMIPYTVGQTVPLVIFLVTSSSFFFRCCVIPWLSLDCTIPTWTGCPIL